MDIFLNGLQDAFFTTLYFGGVALTTLLIKYVFKLKGEWYRKSLHLFFMGSIFPFLYLFDFWYTSVITMVLLMVFALIGLTILGKFSFYSSLLAERKKGEVKRSIALAFFTYILITSVVWGLFGKDHKYIVLASILSWGIGDALAALVGQGKNTTVIKHKFIKCRKTVEGSLAMFMCSLVIIFFIVYFTTKDDVINVVIIPFVTSLLATITETIAKEGDDTLWVPLIISMTLLASTHLFY
ncbi:MAG: hypothetical protein WC968_01130 [Bacilli bacterium]